MIESQIINNKEYGLQERERLITDLVINESTPHVLLATCNRTELYWGTGEVPTELVEHLFRVASGLESSIVGERAIQGQLKQAYMEAIENYSLSAGLNRLFQHAMHTGKRVRSETRISEGAVSHSQVAVDILKDKKIDFQSCNIAVVGVNKLNADILKFLYARNAKKVVGFNRHEEKAKIFSAPYGYEVRNLVQSKDSLKDMDVLISATSAPYALFSKADFPKGKEMWVIDLAFPRDVEEDVASLPSVTLYNIEDIEAFAKKNLKLRHDEIGKAEAIIGEELEKFMTWQSHSLLKE